jgi:hypothetical protein
MWMQLALIVVALVCIVAAIIGSRRGRPVVGLVYLFIMFMATVAQSALYGFMVGQNNHLAGLISVAGVLVGLFGMVMAGRYIVRNRRSRLEG